MKNYLSYSEWKIEKELNAFYNVLSKLEKNYTINTTPTVLSLLIETLNELIDFKKQHEISCTEEKEMLNELAKKIEVK